MIQTTTTTYGLDEFIDLFSSNPKVQNINWNKRNKLNAEMALYLTFGGYWKYNTNKKTITHTITKFSEIELISKN
jgi:hypothetical protein